MAGETAAVPLLLGMGLDVFSVGNESLSSIGWQLSRQSDRWDKAFLKQAAEAAMDLDDARSVRRYVESRFPELYHTSS
uniref:hypothetical protein n=1 Tax=Cohnella rhizosphaerae TaxID=1457232 RepID=UPI003B8A7A6F